MIKCNNPKCGYEDRKKKKVHICPRCGYIMHPVKSARKEKSDGDKQGLGRRHSNRD